MTLRRPTLFVCIATLVLGIHLDGDLVFHQGRRVVHEITWTPLPGAADLAEVAAVHPHKADHKQEALPSDGTGLPAAQGHTDHPARLLRPLCGDHRGNREELKTEDDKVTAVKVKSGREGKVIRAPIRCSLRRVESLRASRFAKRVARPFKDVESARGGTTNISGIRDLKLFHSRGIESSCRSLSDGNNAFASAPSNGRQKCASGIFKSPRKDVEDVRQHLAGADLENNRTANLARQQAGTRTTEDFYLSQRHVDLRVNLGSDVTAADAGEKCHISARVSKTPVTWKIQNDAFYAQETDSESDDSLRLLHFRPDAFCTDPHNPAGIKMKEFQPNGTNSRCQPRLSRMEEVLANLSLTNLQRKETLSTCNRELLMVSLCLTLMVCSNRDLKQTLMAMLKQTSPVSLRKLLQDLLKGLAPEGDLSGLPDDLGKQAADSDDHKKEINIPNTHNKARRYGHAHITGKEQNGSGVQKAGGNTGETCDRDHDKNYLKHAPPHYYPAPRRPVVITAFPAAFLPSMGSSPQDNMSHLGCRLASLSALPASCDVSRVRLAQAGFYYDNSKTSTGAGNAHEVVCYSCGTAYSQWKTGDNPEVIHRRLKPDCLHLNNSGGADSGFFSSMSSASCPSMKSSGSSMRTMSSGYGSMPSVSSQQSAESVTDSRSYGSELETDCDAMLPAPLPSPRDSSNQSATAMGPARDSVTAQPSNQDWSFVPRDGSNGLAQARDDRPMLSMDFAVYPQFSLAQERRATFTGWPLTEYFLPDDLVMQGFYYAGYADCIRCFYCGVGLKSWAENDDVMVEHIRYRPSCGYLLNIKGRHFVNSVLQRIKSSSSGDQNNLAPSASQGSSEPNPATTTHPASSNRPSPSPAQRTANTSSAAAPSPARAAGPSASREVLDSVKAMGFDQDIITRADRQLQREGVTRVNAETLVAKIIDLQPRDSASSTTTTSATNLQTDGPEEVSLLRQDKDELRVQTLRQENSRLKHRQTCKICNSAKVGMIFLPCGHVTACSDCGSKTRKCNTCDQVIRATANVFLS